MSRKLLILSVVFVIFVAAGAYLWLFGRPAVANKNPLEKVNLDTVERMTFTNGFGVTRLVKLEGVWKMVEPYQDVVDPKIPDDLTLTLKSFSLGTVISENPARYADFRVDPQLGSHVEVFLAGQEKPVLDAYVGKQADDSNKSFFRFATSSGPVYIANELPDYLFRRAPREFRLSRVVPLPPEFIGRYKLVSAKQTWEIAGSSVSWSTASGKPVATGIAEELNQIVRRMPVSNFVEAEVQPAVSGLDEKTPYLTLTMETASLPAQSITVTFGKNGPPEMPSKDSTRYVRVSGRPGPMIVNEKHVKELLEVAAKLPK